MPWLREQWMNDNGQLTINDEQLANRYDIRVAWWLEFIVSLKQWYSWAPGLVLGTLTFYLTSDITFVAIVLRK